MNIPNAMHLETPCQRKPDMMHLQLQQTVGILSVTCHPRPAASLNATKRLACLRSPKETPPGFVDTECAV